MIFREDILQVRNQGVCFYVLNDGPLLDSGFIGGRACLDPALGLKITGVIPNHCDQTSPEEHLVRLQRIAQTCL